MRYSLCANVLGVVIEIVDGRKFGQFLKEELFESLEMKNTGFFIPKEKESRLRMYYEQTSNGLLRLTQSMPVW